MKLSIEQIELRHSMQTSVEKTGAISRKMTVTVPSERVQKASNIRLKELSKNVKIDGFRKGKVPMSIVKSRYGDSVYFEVVEKVIDETVREALAAEKMNPAALPDVSPTTMEPGKDLVYEADFDLMPEIKDVDLKGVKIKTAVATVADEDVDLSLEQLQKQQIEWKEVKRKSKKGDRVIVDFTGSIDGVEFAGGKAEEAPVVLGEGQMLEDFEKGLKGLNVGQETTIEVKFPKDYPGEEVAGKKAEFAIKVHSVSEPKLPVIDDEFAKRYNSDDVKALREEVKKTMGVNVENTLSSVNRVRVFDALVSKVSIDVPRKLVKEEVQRMIENQKDQMRQRGMDPEAFGSNEEAMEPEAKKRVALGLIMMKYIEEKEIKVDQSQVAEYIEKMASGYEDPAEFINYYNSDQQRMAQVESLVLETQVVESLLESATASEEKVNVKDLLDGKVA